MGIIANFYCWAEQVYIGAFLLFFFFLNVSFFDRQILLDLLEEARLEAVGNEESKTVIYANAGTEWRRLGFPRKKFDGIFFFPPIDLMVYI